MKMTMLAWLMTPTMPIKKIWISNVANSTMKLITLGPAIFIYSFISRYVSFEKKLTVLISFAHSSFEIITHYRIQIIELVKKYARAIPDVPIFKFKAKSHTQKIWIIGVRIWQPIACDVFSIFVNKILECSLNGC